MKSPHTGKEMKIHTTRDFVNGVWYYHQFYHCNDTGDMFTDTKLDEGNLERYEKKKDNNKRL